MNSSDYTDEQHNALIHRLRSFGVDDIQVQDSLASLELNKASYNDQDAIIVNCFLDLTNFILRRLTVSSKQLPSCMAVWEDQSQCQLLAARVPWSKMRQLLLLSTEASLEDLLHSLHHSDPSIAMYTLQGLQSFGALRMGGSWAECSIRKYFTKQASSRGRNKLLDEINFYRKLPKSLDSHYLELLFSKENETGVSLGLEYCENPNLRDLLMSMEIEPSEAARILRKVVEFEYGEALNKYSMPTPDGYLKDVHYHRLWVRLAMCLQLDSGLTGLVHAHRLVVNGEQFPNIPAMLYKLESSPSATFRLDPGKVSPHIHGDTHLGNILYDEGKDDFHLVDPRGYPVCDIFYDLGKLSQSYHGGYDLIHEGRHQVAWGVSDDGYTAHVDFKMTAPMLWKKYQELSETMDDTIQEVLGPQEKDIKMKVLFNEAMHFASIAPFHIHQGQTPNLVFPFYAIGARTLARVLNMLGIDVESCLHLHDEALRRLATMGNEPWKFGD
ncbi:MAG: hypothetical protein Q9190_001105 [Brigantiaea leucoxantha]